MTLFVVGRLGELAKKIFELEAVLSDAPTNAQAALDLAAYYQLLDRWPVLDSCNIQITLIDFRLALARLRSASTDFEDAVSSKNTLRLELESANYIACKNAAKSKMSALNAMGRFFGPIMEVTIDQEIK